jgi:hypothetical protein
MFNIYQESGYLNMRKILYYCREQNIPFILIIGGRATGKTYGALEVSKEDDIKFMYMRRTQSQADIINKPEFTPFKSLNTDFGWNIGTQAISKYSSGFYNQEKIDEVFKCVGAPIGYTCALSTVSNLRGFDASDVDLLIYDEFIPEKHERPIKNEGAAFLNAYETINRNRELKGKKPVQVLCLANAVDLANPILLELELVKKADQMKRKKQEVYFDRDRGICMIIMDNSPISNQKRATALYRLTKNSAFAGMSLNNNFTGEEIGRIKSKPLIEYIPIVVVGELCIYQHKSNHTLYASMHKMGTPPSFGTGDTERCRFRRQFSWLWDEYMENNIEFEEYLAEILLTKIFQ